MPTLSTPRDVRSRRGRADEPHVRSLNAYVRGLRRAHGPTPYFDPDGAGDRATILLLMSDPGPRGAAVTLIASIDNPDVTASNLRELLAAAGIHRDSVAAWNIVPWCTPMVTAAEIVAGASALDAVIPLLPQLRVVVAMGRAAQAGWAMISPAHPLIRTVETWHPAQRALIWPGRRAQVVGSLKQARRHASA